MGYDMWTNGSLRIPAAKIPEMTELLVKHLSDTNYGDAKDIQNIREDRTPLGLIEAAGECVNESFSLQARLYDSDVELEFDNDGSIRHESNHHALVRLLAPFIDPETHIEFRGEDDAIWRWTFKNGEFNEDYGVVAFEDASAAIKTLRAIVELLYPDNKVRNKWPKDTAAEIANILREHSFGPLADKDLLQVMAEESEAE